MFKSIKIIFIICFLSLPALAFAEFAPQFNKSKTDNTDISSQAPKQGQIYKNQQLMENNVSKNKNVMENNASKNKTVKGNNEKLLIKNNVNKGKNVMENQAP